MQWKCFFDQAEPPGVDCHHIPAYLYLYAIHVRQFLAYVFKGTWLFIKVTNLVTHKVTHLVYHIVTHLVAHKMTHLVAQKVTHLVTHIWDAPGYS